MLLTYLSTAVPHPLLQAIVEPPLPHDPADGICVDPSNPIPRFPVPTPLAITNACQLISPPPNKLLESDRTELFELAVAGATQVAVGCSSCYWVELQPAPGRPGWYAGVVVVPRCEVCYVRGKFDGQEGWQQLLGLHVRPQVCMGLSGHACLCSVSQQEYVFPACWHWGCCLLPVQDLFAAHGAAPVDNNTMLQ